MLTIFSCSENGTDPVPDKSRHFSFTTGDILSYDNQAVLFTDTDNNRLEYREIEAGQTYEFEFPADTEINMHVVRYDEEEFMIRSHIGYEEDSFHLRGISSLDWREYKTVSFDFNKDISPWIMSAGEGSVSYFHGYEPRISIHNSLNMLYFMRNEYENDANDGYLFIEDFDLSNDTFRIEDTDLLPLTDLVQLEYDFPSGFTPSIIIKAKPANKEANYPLSMVLFEQPIGDLHKWYEQEVYVPDFDVFESYETQINYGWQETGKYSYVSYSSSYRADHPGIPSFADADVEIHDATPGQFHFTGSGTYSYLQYRFVTQKASWYVVVYDETADYASYPDFPDEFYQNVPNATLENLKIQVELGEYPTSVLGGTVHDTGNELRYVSKNINQ